MNQLLQDLCDEDGIRTLHKKMKKTSVNLNEYFMRLIEFIASQDRKIVSQLLQLALYEEDEFVCLHSNRVLDFSFIEEGNSNFALNPFYSFSQLDFVDRGVMVFRLEFTIRKLNSRCMGLLNICDQKDYIFFDFEVFSDNNSDTSNTEECEYPPSDQTNTFLDGTQPLDDSKEFVTAQLTVDFLHRSLRDFLLTRKVQTLLHQYTHDLYDARMYFRSARLVQLMTLNKVEVNLEAEIDIATYILITLTVSDFRDTSDAAAFAFLMRPVIENLIRFEHVKLLKD
jgi:hypothetical protein